MLVVDPPEPEFSVATGANVGQSLVPRETTEKLYLTTQNHLICPDVCYF